MHVLKSLDGSATLMDGDEAGVVPNGEHEAPRWFLEVEHWLADGHHSHEI